jgi:hypothetical protein
VALVRNGKVHARGTAVIKAAGTHGYRLAFPKKLKPGAYTISVTFTAPGVQGAVTRKLKLTVQKAK